MKLITLLILSTLILGCSKSEPQPEPSTETPPDSPVPVLPPVMPPVPISPPEPVDLTPAPDPVAFSYLSLSWWPPTERACRLEYAVTPPTCVYDPLPIEEIAGYNIFIDSDKEPVWIEGGYTNDWKFYDWPPGVYSFTITTVDTEKRESVHSKVLVVTNII